MERLIYANALIRCLDEKVADGWHSCSLTINMGYIDGMADAIHAIDDQITIDAIPVEWLKENYPTNGVYGTESYFRKAHAVEDILKDWEREKEGLKK